MTRRSVLLLAVLLPAGCAPRPRFLGTWSSGAATLSLNSDGVVVVGNALGGERGRWNDLGEGVLEILASGANKASHSRWWVSEDGKTLTLTPLDANDREIPEGVVTYLRQ
ncbi:MAG: hypothetical protein ACO1SX_13740 [Actinomycetota bacterium]